MENKIIHYDLKSITYDEFIQILFFHDVEKDPDKIWYLSENIIIEFDEQHLVDLYKRLFKETLKLFEKYSIPQIEQGLHSLIDCNFPGNMEELIWESKLPTSSIIDFIKSMYFIFKDFFSIKYAEIYCGMWWDPICHKPGWKYGPESLVNMKRVKKIQNTIFDTLCKILNLNSSDCRFAALHGLGHLHYPGTKEVIEKYILHHPELSEEDIKYANECITGIIM